MNGAVRNAPVQVDGNAASGVQPFRAAVFPTETAAEFADGIEVAFEVGKRKVAGGIVESLFPRFAGRANCKHTRFNGFASIQSVVAADFEQARVALTVIQIPFDRGGHGHDSGGAQNVCFF